MKSIYPTYLPPPPSSLPIFLSIFLCFFYLNLFPSSLLLLLILLTIFNFSYLSSRVLYVFSMTNTKNPIFHTLRMKHGGFYNTLSYPQRFRLKRQLYGIYAEICSYSIGVFKWKRTSFLSFLFFVKSFSILFQRIKNKAKVQIQHSDRQFKEFQVVIKVFCGKALSGFLYIHCGYPLFHTIRMKYRILYGYQEPNISCPV